MPRASYGDKHTVSVMQGSNHAVFDFTSKVIDFVTLTRANENASDEDKAGTLYSWVKVFRIIPEFRILRLTFHRKSASKS